MRRGAPWLRWLGRYTPVSTVAETYTMYLEDKVINQAGSTTRGFQENSGKFRVIFEDKAAREHGEKIRRGRGQYPCHFAVNIDEEGQQQDPQQQQ